MSVFLCVWKTTYRTANGGFKSFVTFYRFFFFIRTRFWFFRHRTSGQNQAVEELITDSVYIEKLPSTGKTVYEIQKRKHSFWCTRVRIARDYCKSYIHTSRHAHFLALIRFVRTKSVFVPGLFRFVVSQSCFWGYFGRFVRFWTRTMTVVWLRRPYTRDTSFDTKNRNRSDSRPCRVGRVIRKTVFADDPGVRPRVWRGARVKILERCAAYWDPGNVGRRRHWNGTPTWSPLSRPGKSTVSRSSGAFDGQPWSSNVSLTVLTFRAYFAALPFLLGSRNARRPCPRKKTRKTQIRRGKKEFRNTWHATNRQNRFSFGFVFDTFPFSNATAGKIYVSRVRRVLT